MEWFKKRRSVSAEAIARHGRDVAVTQADKQLMNKLQYEFEAKFFTYLKAAPTKVNGKSMQEALANAWGKLTTFAEFRGAKLVYFVNPLDVAEYLGSTPVLSDASNVFGMTLIKNFLGVDNVVMLNSVPKGKIYATAVDNLVFAYLDVRTSEVANTFAQFTDNLGFIGASRDVQQNRLTLDSVFFGANTHFAEVPEGVVEATIKAPTSTAA
ncbi:phage capsid protein [Aerococcus urinae]|nr:phage capsid protein [Aerococcus urinae]